MKEQEDPAARSASLPRTCPKCRIVNRPRQVICGSREITATYLCWSCRHNYSVAFAKGDPTPKSQGCAE